MSLESSLKELNEYLGKEVLVGDWVEITRERINQFADSTNDHQWIHVDEEKAKNGPFGQIIAHGYLTLCFVPYYFYQLPFQYEGAKFRLNYGLDKVRFLAPVPVGSRIRDRLVLSGVEEQKGNRLQIRVSHTFEIEGTDTPACIADSIGLVMF